MEAFADSGTHSVSQMLRLAGRTVLEKRIARALVVADGFVGPTEAVTVMGLLEMRTRHSVSHCRD